MAQDMPTATQLQNAFGGRGAQVQARNTAKDLKEQERAGRLMRDAQIQTNCSYVADIDCVFSTEASPAQFVSDWIEFGNLRFTQEPGLACGSKRQAQSDETALNAEASNYDPEEHLSFPAFAQLLRTKSDDRGMISGAKVICFALGAVPSGFKVKVSVIFIGPAIRKG
jgi:hypothetical protein